MAEWAQDLFQVSIKGPGPYGFRLYGGHDDPLIVAKLRARSKAHDAGLREGDAVLGINGRSCQAVSHGVAMTLLETADEVLRLHLYRGSTSRKTIAAVYNAIGNQLRPVSPGTTPPNRSAAVAQPPPAAAETVDSAAPPPPAAEDAPRNVNVTSSSSYSRQEVTSSIGAGGVTQKTTTETEDRGGVTVTRVTRELVVGGGGSAVPTAAAAADEESDPAGNGHRSTVLFHSVPKQFKVQPMRWTPSGVGTKEQTSIHQGEDRENLAPNNNRRIDLFGELGGPGDPHQFKVFKTTAKLAVWQPSDVPSLPVRDPSPPMTFEVLETRGFQARPQQQEGEGSRPQRHSDAVDGSDDSDSFGISSHLFHVLTTEATYDDDLLMGRKRKIFADSSFYDDPEKKYPTIEEQIKMARKVALSLSAPDNVTARGQRMFMKRKEKANYWSTDQSLDGINPYVVAMPRAAAPPGTTSRLHKKTAKDHLGGGGGGGGGGLHYSLTPWSVAASSVEQEQAKQVVEKVVTEAIGDTLDGLPEDREQSSAAFAKNRALFEKGVDGGGGGGGGELPWKKAPPSGSGGPAAAQLYAGIVDDLKGMKGRGAKLFAQKRAKALEEEEGQEAEGRQGEGETGGGGGGGPRRRERGGEDYNEAPERGTDVEDASSARRLEELISISRSHLNPWEPKAAPAAATTGQAAVLTPWQAKAAAYEAASAQRQQTRKGRPDDDDAWLQETTTDNIPGFIAQKTPSTSYRPVRFHIRSNGPGCGITDF